VEISITETDKNGRTKFHPQIYIPINDLMNCIKLDKDKIEVSIIKKLQFNEKTKHF